MNEQTQIEIKTPFGVSPQFSCPMIVKQGAVLSTNLCGSTTGQLMDKLDTVDDSGATIGSATVRGVMFVDDTTTTNRNPVGSEKSNRAVQFFSHTKRLQLNIPKCVQLIVNLNRSEVPPSLTIDNNEITNVRSAKCLGDIFTSNGSNNELVADRVNKGKSIIITALSLCNDITLGHHSVRSAITVYNSVFLHGILFNSQAWSDITQTQMSELQTIQLKFLKRIVQAPSSTSNSFTYLELGILPVQYEFDKRQLSFLHHITHMDPNQPLSQIQHQQSLFTYEHNWTYHINHLLRKYNLTDIDVKSMSKSQWKSQVHSALVTHAFHTLKAQCRSQSKSYSLEYESFQTQRYLLTLPFKMASFVFRLRARNLICKDNHHKAFTNLICRMCNVEIENQEHIMNCSSVFAHEPKIYLDSIYCKNYQPNLAVVKVLMNRYTVFHEHKHST